MATSPTYQHYHSRQQRQQPDNVKQENNHSQHQQQQPQRSLCDFCNQSIALLYCRADSAKLCFACDRHVHATNRLFSKHLRSHLCDVCDSRPASIRCSTHDLFLCHNCDWDAHDGRRSPGAHHDRRPLEGFSGCPSAFEFCSVLGFEDKSLLESDEGRDLAATVDGFLDSWVWETPPIVSLDDLVVSTTNDSCHNFQAVGFPPPPKHRNVACGKHKDEILGQLRHLVKSETNLNNDHGEVEPLQGFQCVVPDQNLQQQDMGTDVKHDPVPIAVPSSEASTLQWQGYGSEEIARVPSYKGLLESSIEETSLVLEGTTSAKGNGNQANDNKIAQHHPFITETAILLPKSTLEVPGQDRDTVISRYKEKKKTRRYDKHIRYESRKARADSRTRIKGRFAKVNQDQNVRSVPRQV
ncbi:zinc finger protein CONSTANS-LIKE 13 [Magnolia sinica]|uniref:zinc finger protein CONSTANS-LIKE 13 n=1 Tax=Magnolia sinica TaxID=86752 RepID=UPI002657F841|nr:zinc finger protein CONSTANS-LIKE 13 [Magnolia sinica]